MSEQLPIRFVEARYEIPSSRTTWREHGRTMVVQVGAFSVDPGWPWSSQVDREWPPMGTAQ